MGSSWSVDGVDLQDRPRMGGVNAEKGFAFQKAFALAYLTWLPVGQQGLVELRYEGAQDVDLHFGKVGEVFAQAKDYREGGVTLDVLYGVIAGFARDVISAKAAGRDEHARPKYRLVCTSMPTTPDALELLRRVYKQKHAKAIAALIRPEYRKNFSNQVVLDCVLEAIDRTAYDFFVRHGAVADLKAQASWNLARFGVPVEHVSSCLDSLEAALLPRTTFQPSDVIEHLTGLPQGHPGREDSPCRVLPSRRHLTMTPMLRVEFLRGSVHSLWCAIANDMDVRRNEAKDVHDALMGLSCGGMVLVEGAGGTGKSTLIRRVAWDLRLSGSHLLLEVPSPGELNDTNWTSILRLAKLADMPVLLVVDDVWRSQSFIDELPRYIKHNLCVLATSRPGEQPDTDSVGFLVHRVHLRSLSPEVVRGVRLLVQSEGSPTVDASAGQIERFATTGQLLALSLTLQSGSLKEFAKSILRPLESKTDVLAAFLDLCVIGRFDHTAPLSIFERLTPPQSCFWRDERFSGLADVQSGGGSRRLRVGHALVADAIVEVSGAVILDRVIGICESCDPTSSEERRFITRLLASATTREELKKAPPSFGKRLAATTNILLPVASYADAHRLFVILTAAGQPQAAAQFLNAATPDRIHDSVDAGIALSRGKDEFPGLYSALLKFFEKESAALGRRRFVKAAMKFGTPAQQLEVANQTAAWIEREGFSSEEMRALFNLGAAAKDLEVPKRLAPLIKPYLKSDGISLEVVICLVQMMKRIKDAELREFVVLRVVKMLESSTPWTLEQTRLARQLAILMRRQASNEATKVQLSALLLRMQQHVGRWRDKLPLLRAAIAVTPSASCGSLRDSLTALETQLNKVQTTGLWIQFERQFGPDASTQNPVTHTTDE